MSLPGCSLQERLSGSMPALIDDRDDRDDLSEASSHTLILENDELVGL